MVKKHTYENVSGFTLIELLIVVAIIAVLSIVTLTAIKPAQRLSDARDARRAGDVNQILTAIHQCAIDKKDSKTLATCLGTVTTGNTYEIVTGNVTSGCQTTCSDATSDSSCLPLDSTLSDYFVSLPQDPSITDSSHSGYSVRLMSNGMTVLGACKAENGTILVSE